MSLNPLPLISVIIPAFNAENGLFAAIESVLQQAYQPLEIIVVDDGSTDATGSIARQASGVTCIEQENQGASGARNTGIRASQGEVIAFLDSDDLWLPRHIEFLLRSFKEDAAIEFTWGSTQLDLTNAASNIPHHPAEEPWTVFSLGAGLFRRNVFEHVGFFDQRLKTGNDLDWFCRATQLGVPCKRIPETVQIYRKRPESLTGDVVQMQADRMRMFRHAAARRREANRKSTEQPGKDQ